MGPKGQPTYDKMVAMIRGGQFRPGDKLPSERDLLARFGVGRTLMRQVLTRLAAEGAIETRPREGYFIPEVRFNDRRDDVVREKQKAARRMTCGHDVTSQCENCDETERVLRRELNIAYGDVLAGRGAMRTLMRAHHKCGTEDSR